MPDSTPRPARRAISILALTVVSVSPLTVKRLRQVRKPSLIRTMTSKTERAQTKVDAHRHSRCRATPTQCAQLEIREKYRHDSPSANEETEG
eukprot:2035011-Pyramimonas_sp.AAC.1